MENKNSWIIVLIIILLVLVLGLSGFIVYDKVFTKTDKTNSKENNSLIHQEQNTNNSESNNVEYQIPDNVKTYNVSLEKEACVDVNSSLDYPYDKNNGEYAINIDNIVINNKKTNYKYYTNQNVEVEYYNNKVIKFKDNMELILTNVCNYNNYLLTVEGYEGEPLIKLIDSNGKIVYENIGKYEYKNGILYLTKIIHGGPNNSTHTYQEVSVDLAKEIRENITKTKEFNCDNYQSEEKRIQEFCEFGS